VTAKTPKQGALKYELLLLVMAIIWGSAFAAQQIGMKKGITPMAFNALRFSLGVLVLLPVMVIRGKFSSGITTKTPFPFWGSMFAGLFLFSAAGCQQIGLKYTSCANAGFITGLYIVLVPLIGLFFGHKVNKSLWFGIAVCIVGLYFLSITGDFKISKGDLLVLLCAFLWAGQILVIDHVVNDSDPLKIAIFQFVVCAVLSGISALLFESCSLEAIKAGAGAVAYAGVMSVGIAFTLQVFCQKHCPPGPAAVIMSMEAVFAAIAGYLVLNERLSLRAIGGCALILAGLLIAQLVPMIARKKKRAVEEVPAGSV
jgi:drug/metabolite transporter (DMT)-like permease